MNIDERIAFLSETLPKVFVVGKKVFDPFWSNNFHKDPSCELLMPLNAPLTVCYEDGRRYRAAGGEVLIIPPYTSHCDKSSQDQEPIIFFCSFKWDKYEEYLTLVNNDSIGKMSKRTTHDFYEIIDGLSRDLAGGSKLDQLISATRLLTALMVLLRDVLLKADDTLVIHSQSRKRKLLNEAKQYIENNFNRPISLDEIAEELDISAYYLSHVFSEGNGMPLFEYLLDIRMKKAVELLATGELNVSQIAHAVGYDNPNYFSRTFKKYFGVIPSKWQNRATK